jgi:hypothetical protein
MGKSREPVPDVSGRPGDTLFSHASAVAWLASLDPKPKDDERIRRGRARKRIKGWVDKGVLTETPSGQFKLGDLVRGFLATWPTRIGDVPAAVVIPVTVTGGLTARLPRLKLFGHGLTLPMDIESCHRLIREYDEALEVARMKICELEPDAVRHRERVADGKKGGRPKRK